MRKLRGRHDLVYTTNLGRWLQMNDWLKDRFLEPSSWAGLGVALVSLGSASESLFLTLIALLPAGAAILVRDLKFKTRRHY